MTPKSLGSLEIIIKNTTIFKIKIDKKEDLEETQAQDEDTRHLNGTIYNQSKFYNDFKLISESVEAEPPSKSCFPVNLYYNPLFLEMFLKKYITYLPLWSNIYHAKTLSNRHVESYFAIR